MLFLPEVLVVVSDGVVGAAVVDAGVGHHDVLDGEAHGELRGWGGFGDGTVMSVLKRNHRSATIFCTGLFVRSVTSFR